MANKEAVVMVEVLLDTNFILYALEKKLGLENIIELFDERVALITVPAVKEELIRISNGKGKEGVLASIALELNIPVVRVSGSYADEQLLNYLKENEDAALASNDFKLIKKAKELGRRVVVVKKGRFGLY